jgi:hypothetical protein
MPIVHSIEKKRKSVFLRENGKSLRTIARELTISLSTAQLWTREVILSNEQKQNIVTEHREKLIAGRTKFIEHRKAQKNKKELKIFTDAKNEILVKKSDSFFIIGLALYWAEGSKKDHSLGFINSDPAMVQVFLRWLKTYGKFDPINIHPRLQIHEIYKSNTNAIQSYWSDLLQIPLSQFQTPFYQVSKSKPTLVDPEYKGLLRIRVSGTRNLFIKILGWLEGLKQINYSNEDPVPAGPIP